MFARTLRTLLMAAMVVSVAACSSKDKSAMENVRVDETPAVAGPLDGTEAYPGANMGVTPGSQQDLVVNVGDRVFFGYDQYNLTPEGQNTLGLQAEWLKKYPNVNVTISGHCDERGTREYNLALGDRRANAVKNQLVALGIPVSRINTISYGKERPAVLGSSESAWAQNRRSVTEVN